MENQSKQQSYLQVYFLQTRKVCDSTQGIKDNLTFIDHVLCFMVEFGQPSGRPGTENLGSLGQLGKMKNS